MLQTTITVVPARGPSPLREHLTSARESGTPVDFVVLPVSGGSDNGKPSDGGQRGDSAIPLGDGRAIDGAEELESYLPGGVDGLLRVYEASGTAGEIIEAPADLGAGLVRVILLGTGDGSAAAWRRAGAALGRRVAKGRTAVTVLGAQAADDSVRAFAEGALLASYRYDLEAPEPNGTHRGAVWLLALEPSRAEAAAGAARRASAVAEAVAFARDLVNTPSLRKSPQWLAEQAAQLAARCGLRIRARDADELAADGFGGIIAVGSGSAHPPRLIELTYEPAAWATHVVLVGKGITFDSGGLSLKPLDGMKGMKTDMAGGAAVMAVLSALGALGARSKVTGLIAAAENMPSGSAMRPGDVITHFGGRTVEVLNTDAEGRLVLADALAYADQTLSPDALVDVATLTGAARVALGTTVGAVFSDDDQLAAALAAAGEACGERLWRLPLVDEYRDALDSTVADLAHVATHRRYGRPGAIEAALFLREFTGGRSWAHLDIAGPARAASDEGEISKGGTGFGTRILLHWLAGL
ncbi:MAG: leucyl aminopeptidase [Micromonosporaceae bacterium]